MIDRLQKKCLVGSALMHGALLLVVIASVAFSPRQEPAQYIELIAGDFKITDAPTQGTAAPAAPAPQPQPQPVAQPPSIPTPPPQPAPPAHTEPVVTAPTPRVTEPPRPRTPVDVPKLSSTHPTISVDPPKQTTKPKNSLDLSHPVDLHTSPAFTKRQADAQAQAKADADARATARKDAQRVASTLGGAISNIQRGTAGAVVVASGASQDGPAAVNYRDFVFKAYYDAWTPPDNVDNDMATVEARVVVNRDGTIDSAEVIKRTGQSALDKSVADALKMVRKLPAFPEGSKDTQRSYRILFNLKSKQGTG